MARSTIQDRRGYRFDKELELRAYDAAAVSATGSTTGVAIAGLTKMMSAAVVINVAAYTSYAAGTAQWSLQVEASANDSTYVAVGNPIVPVGTADQFEIPLSGVGINDRIADAGYLRITATKTGSPGNITYNAFLCPAP